MKYVANAAGIPVSKKLWMVHVMDQNAFAGHIFDVEAEAIEHASQCFEQYKGAKPVAIYEMTKAAIPVVPKVTFTDMK